MWREVRRSNPVNRPILAFCLSMAMAPGSSPAPRINLRPIHSIALPSMKAGIHCYPRTVDPLVSTPRKRPSQPLDGAILLSPGPLHDPPIQFLPRSLPVFTPRVPVAGPRTPRGDTSIILRPGYLLGVGPHRRHSTSPMPCPSLRRRAPFDGGRSDISWLPNVNARTYPGQALWRPFANGA